MIKWALLVWIFLFSHLSYGLDPRSEFATGQTQTPSGISSDPIEICLKKRTVPDGSWTHISKVETEPCRNSRHGRHEGPTNYSVRTNEGRIEVRIQVNLDYKGSAENWSMVESKLKTTLPCVKDFYKRNGIELSLEAKINSKKDRFPKGTDINVHDEDFDSDVENWIVLGRADDGGDMKSKVVEISNEDRCLSIAHEIGHLMGLPDRYPDLACPDRKIGPQDGLMGSKLGGISRVRLYPADLQKIVQPLCEGAPKHK